MTLLNVGQPIGAIIQVTYTVPDIEKAVRSYAQDLKLGPWFLRGPLQARKPVYRGNPQKLELRHRDRLFGAYDDRAHSAA